MLNSACFKSDQVRCKIMGAMRRSMTKNYSQFIKNKNGGVWLYTSLNYDKQKSLRHFRFIDSDQNDITELVYSSLK